MAMSLTRKIISVKFKLVFGHKESEILHNIFNQRAARFYFSFLSEFNIRKYLVWKRIRNSWRTSQKDVRFGKTTRPTSDKVRRSYFHWRLVPTKEWFTRSLCWQWWFIHRGSFKGMSSAVWFERIGGPSCGRKYPMTANSKFQLLKWSPSCVGAGGGYVLWPQS